MKKGCIVFLVSILSLLLLPIFSGAIIVEDVKVLIEPELKGDFYDFYGGAGEALFEFEFNYYNYYYLIMNDDLRPFACEGRWGYVNSMLEEVISLKYDYTTEFDDGLAKVELDGKWGFINKEGREVVPLKYDQVSFFNEGIVMAELDGKWGFIDKEGREVVPLKYNQVSWFVEGLARVELDGKWGFVDKEGREVVPLKYNQVNMFHDGLAKVELDGKWGFVDKEGREVIPLKYDVGFVYSVFNEGIVMAELDGKWGFIDKEGREVIPLKYDYVNRFEEGLAAVELDGKWGFINKEGREVIPLKYDRASLLFVEGFAGVELDGKWGFIDKEGREVIPLKYDYVSDFNGGFVEVELDGKVGFIDKEGREVIPFKYDRVDRFVEGLAGVRLDGKYGSVNKEGREIVPLKYDSAVCFNEGFAKVELDGKWGFVDKEGREIVPVKYDCVDIDMSEGMSIVFLFLDLDEKDWSERNGKYGVLNEQGEEVVPFSKYERILGFSEGLAGFQQGNKWGFINKEGKVIVKPEYSLVCRFSNGRALVQLDDKWGVLEIVATNTETSSPTLDDEGYLYNIQDPGKEVVLPSAELTKVTDQAGAVKAITDGVQKMTPEQKESPTGIDLVTLYSEEAVSQVASCSVLGNKVEINSETIGSLADVSREVKAAAETALVTAGITPHRKLRTGVKFKVADAEKVVITVEPMVGETDLDSICVESPSFAVSFIPEDLGEEPLVITVSEISSGNETGASWVNFNPNLTTGGLSFASYNSESLAWGKFSGHNNVFVGSSLPTKTYQVSFNQGTLTENIKIALPRASGDVKYQAVLNEKGLPVGGKYNPATNMIEVKIKDGGTYTVKENKKDFTDIVNKSGEMQEAIRILASKGIIGGTSATTFSPDSPISRAEIAALMVRTLAKMDPLADGGFTDVTKNDWYYAVAGSSKKHGIIKGYDDHTFRGNTTITKDQIVVVASRILRMEMGYLACSDSGTYLAGYNDKADIPDWAQGEIALATRENLVLQRTDGTFLPVSNMTRGDAAIILKRLFERIW